MYEMQLSFVRVELSYTHVQSLYATTTNTHGNTIRLKKSVTILPSRIHSHALPRNCITAPFIPSYCRAEWVANPSKGVRHETVFSVAKSPQFRGNIARTFRKLHPFVTAFRTLREFVTENDWLLPSESHK